MWFRFLFSSIVIVRLKEELIRELVKTGQSTKQLNKNYLTKIQNLETVRFIRLRY